MGLLVFILIIILDFAVIYHIHKTRASKFRKILNSLVIIFLPIIGVTFYYLFLE